MKLNGKTLIKPNIELIVIPRGDGEDIVFKAQGVNDTTVFENLCPLPEPPTRVYPGGRKAQDVTAPEYLKKMAEHNTLRFHFMMLESLKVTDSLEWETVDMGRPETWKNYTDELTAAGLTNTEVNMVVNGVLAANCLNEDRIEEARQRFLASQQEALERSSTLKGEQPSMESGEPANA